MSVKEFLAQLLGLPVSHGGGRPKGWHGKRSRPRTYTSKSPYKRPLTGRKPSGFHKKQGAKKGWNSRSRAQNKLITQKEIIAFHGTPTAQNAADILKNGFLAGAGNALGSGVYLSTNLTEAKAYARGTGVYLKCVVKPKRICMWDNRFDQQFRAWCAQHNVHPDTNARTSFLLRQGYDTLQAGTVLVALRPLFANPTAHKVKLRQVRVLGVFRADNDRKIRV